MIALYPCRPGGNEELRISLRSLSNLPEVDAVWIVGDMPSWCRPDHFIKANRHRSGHRNVFDNIRIGCRALADEPQIVIMNDDFMITERVETIPSLYRGSLAEHINLPRHRRNPTSWWPVSLTTTRTCLQAHGIAQPRSYELHTPFVCDPARMADMLDMMAAVTPDNPPQWRTIYGNLADVDATQAEDGKVYGAGELRRPFMSTQDDNFALHRDALTALFPTTSRWERR